MDKDLDSLASRVRLARSKRGLTQQQLADISGMEQPDISKIERGRILQTTGIARIAQGLQVPVLWLESGKGQEPDWDAPATPQKGADLRAVVAHAVSQPSDMMTPPHLDWESLVKSAPPKNFILEVRDRAMSYNGGGSLEPGHFALFSVDREPVPGQNVLLRDKTGHVCIREYQVRRPGHWLAVPKNPAFQVMDSIEDGLTVIAAQYGHHY